MKYNCLQSYIVLYTVDPDVIRPRSLLVKSFEVLTTRMEPPTTTAAADAAMACVQPLSKVSQSATLQQHKLTLPDFWLQNPMVGFNTFTHVPTNSCMFLHT